MIAAWMLFALEISALLFASAWIAERVLLAARRPVRGVWAAAIVGANLLPFVLSKVQVAQILPADWSFSVASESLLSRMGTALLVVWGIAAAIGFFICLSAVWRMSRTRPQWKTEHVDNTPVLVSHDIGPALVGVMQYSIVVPQWAYSLDEHARRLLLTHEREHARQYDPLLLAGAVLVVVLAPWNVFNWLFFRRLHLAVELDCDQRVLKAHPDARGYSELLLDVAERVLPSVMPAAAFVEHGASLETRLNAMTEQKKPLKKLRVVTGLSASVMLAAAACITPRPYAIVVVVPPTVAPQTATVPTFELEPKAQKTPVEVQQYLNANIASAVEPKRTGSAYWGPKEVWPVAPSARVTALDEAERERLHRIVMQLAPRVLGVWPRSDSALMLIFDAKGEVSKQTIVARTGLIERSGALSAFNTAFVVPQVSGLRATTVMSVDRGLKGEVLQTPLNVYTARMQPGVEAPLSRLEITPTRDAMVSVLRARHPELLADTVESSVVGVLLYDTRGQLVKSAAITMDEQQVRTDGTYNNEYEWKVWRKAFGAVMDSGVIVQNGTFNLVNGKPLRAGPSKIMYVILVKHADFAAVEQLIKIDWRDLPMSTKSSRAGASPVDQAAMNTRLRNLVQSRVPDAYGDWVRSDSAVMFLFDKTDQLVARKAVPIPENAQLRVLANLLSERVKGVRADDIEEVGMSIFTVSTAGRPLDKPLTVLWGRLSTEATYTPPK